MFGAKVKKISHQKSEIPKAIKASIIFHRYVILVKIRLVYLFHLISGIYGLLSINQKVVNEITTLANARNVRKKG